MRVPKPRDHKSDYQRYRKSHLASRAACKLRNPEKVKEWAKTTRRNRRGKLIALKAARRARKLKATPVWANTRAIRDIYEGAQYLTRLTGVQFDVDHIVPLLSPVVCGLHVEHNLQYLTHSENSRKQNQFCAVG